MKRDLILIDGNPFLFKNFFVHTQKKTYYANNPTLIGFIQNLSKIISEYKNPHVIIVFDKGKSKFRKRILKKYKAHRKEQRKKINFDWNLYLKHSEEIINTLKYLFPIISIENYEGDDIIAYYTINSNNSIEINNIYIYSNDKDLLQLIYRDNIEIIINNNRINIDNYNRYTKYNNYKEYLFSKILIGDNSDNIDKIFNKSDINRILRKYNSIDNYLLELKNRNRELYRKVKLNRMLIDLYYFQDKFGKYLEKKIKEKEKEFKYNPVKSINEYLKINHTKHVDKLEKLISLII